MVVFRNIVGGGHSFLICLLIKSLGNHGLYTFRIKKKRWDLRWPQMRLIFVHFNENSITKKRLNLKSNIAKLLSFIKLLFLENTHWIYKVHFLYVT